MQLLKIFHSRYLMFSSCFFCTSKITEFKIIRKNKNIKWDCFVYGCPSLFNLFHFFDIFIKIFFDAITDHHCFFLFSLFFLSHGNHLLLSYESSHILLCWHILLYIYNSSVSFFGLSFIFEQQGGAVNIWKGSVTFTTCSFIDNTAIYVSTTIIKTLFSSCHNI